MTEYISLSSKILFFNQVQQISAFFTILSVVIAYLEIVHFINSGSL